MTTLTEDPPTRRVRSAKPAGRIPVAPVIENRAAKLPSSVKIGNVNINISHVSGMSTEIVTVTPAMATEMLERSHDNGAINRPVKQTRVERYAADMRNNNWRLTGESIKLDCNGNVRDGQNRLFACIEANVPFTTMVTINVPDEAFDVMDSGAPRSPGDVMYIHEFQNPKQTAASARLAIVWERNGRPDTNTYVAKPDLLRWLSLNPNFGSYVALGRKI